QLVDTESEPEEAPSEAEELQSLGSRVPLMGEEFKAFEPIGTRTDSSHSSASSDSTTPLSPDHPLTHVSPTPTPTRVSFHHKTACMTVRPQPTLSPGMSARIAEAAALRRESEFRGQGTWFSLGEEEEAVPEGQQRAVLVMGATMSAPFRLGYGALRRRELVLEEDQLYNTFEVGHVLELH
ncbi:hypothetical protein Tco_0867941, partial [Tanacetum coccineum]